MSYTLVFLTNELYEQYNLSDQTLHTVTFEYDRYGNKIPISQVLDYQHINGQRWDYYLGIRDDGEPFGIMALQWYSLDGFSVTPLVHYDIFKGYFRYVYSHMDSILKSLAEYHGVAKLSICTESLSKHSLRLKKIKKNWNEVLNEISIPHAKLEASYYCSNQTRRPTR